MATPTHVPVSTYRLQLNAAFDFTAAASILEYLDSLGVTDCYLSPVMAARPGSIHGYDVTDPMRINPELGGPEAFADFAQQLEHRGMKIVLDVVPNHMCIGDRTNAWWQDVLENGPSSPFAKFFDIDWRPPRSDLENKVLLPILGDQYGRVLESGKIRVEKADGSFTLDIDGTQLPLAPRTWTLILEMALAAVKSRQDEPEEQVWEFESIITALSYLPPRTETDEERVRERQREKVIVRRRLAALLEQSRGIREAIEESVRIINGTPGDPFSFNTLEDLLARQPYRLSFWRVAADEINYRRFFDVNDLAAVRVEDPGVFEAVHERVLELIAAGWIRGLRVDHADGLFDPAKYFIDLQQACINALGPAKTEDESGKSRPFYIVAEKVLVGDELLRQDWVIYGTTGYGFMNQLNGVFVDLNNRQAFLRLYHQFTGTPRSFPNVVYESKRLILRFSMSSELNVLCRSLDRVCQQHRHSRDFTLENLRFAMLEVIACFPVYRTYIGPGMHKPGEQDERHIRAAVADAKRRNPAAGGEVFDLIGSVLLLQDPPGLTAEQREERRAFVLRFQQLTGPVMAKGLEDTAFYRHFPLASLNEVGGDPETFGLTLDRFHESGANRARNWAHSLNATSTHDTKRSEDVRARINALSEIPREWHEAVRRWHGLCRSFRQRAGGLEIPDRNTEYLLFQTLIGAWPLDPMSMAERDEFVARIQAYMEKATKEAKVYTSWINPHAPFDEGLRNFIARLLTDRPGNRFLPDFLAFQRITSFAGMMNSLSQTVLKIAAPGVPDIYQGTEAWAFSLVDPDNRRPVDFERHKALLATLDRDEEQDRERLLAGLLSSPADGRPKMYVTSRALRCRRKYKELFSDGSYEAITVEGKKSEHVIAFARRLGTRTVIAAAGRFFLKLGARGEPPAGTRFWAETALVVPGGDCCFHDAFTGRVLQIPQSNGSRRLPLEQVFDSLPVALLMPVNA